MRRKVLLAAFSAILVVVIYPPHGFDQWLMLVGMAGVLCSTLWEIAKELGRRR